MLMPKYSNINKQQHDMYFSLFLIVSLALFFLFVRDGYMHDDNLRYVTTVLILAALALYLISFAKKHLPITHQQSKEYRRRIFFVKSIVLFIQINLLAVISFIVVYFFHEYIHVLTETFQVAFLLPLGIVHVSWDLNQFRYFLNALAITILVLGTFKCIHYIIIRTAFSQPQMYDIINDTYSDGHKDENTFIFSTSLGYFYHFSSAN